MRFDGKLKTWNDDRGFGFIEPDQGGQEIFVHVSAFPRDGRRPRLQEPLSFAVETRPDGKKRAIEVRRAVVPTVPAGRHRPVRSARRGSGGLGRILSVLLLIGVIVYGYSTIAPRWDAGAAAPSASPAAATVERASPAFQCDGRTHCSEMRSCAEATFFLKNCPGVQMDGNRDGRPCEQQWCASLWVD